MAIRVIKPTRTPFVKPPDSLSRFLKVHIPEPKPKGHIPYDWRYTHWTSPTTFMCCGGEECRAGGWIVRHRITKKMMCRDCYRKKIGEEANQGYW